MGALADRWRQRESALRSLLPHQVSLIESIALRKAQAVMQAKIYAIPEDRAASGKKKWIRSGDLFAAERTRPVAGIGLGFELVNDMPYAVPRHELGKPGHRRTTRIAHWRDEVRDMLRGEGLGLIHEALVRAFSLGADRAGG